MLARMPAKEYKLKHSFHPGSSGFLPFLFWRYLTACLKMHYYSFLGFAGGSGGKESACNAGDPGSIEKGLATCSSILAWRMPWTEEPGRL